MASVDATFRIIDRASRELRNIRQEAERADRALLRAGASADLIGGQRAQRSYQNAERGIRRVNNEVERGNKLSGIFHNRWLMIGGAVLAAAPLVVRLAAGVTQLVGSLVQAAGGAAVVGGGALGAFLVGVGSVMVAVKGLTNDLKPASQAFEAYNKAVQMYGARSTQAATAQRQLNAALKEAPRGTMALLRNVKALGEQWDKATRSARGYLVQTANYAIGRVRGVMPRLAGIVNENTAAVAGAGRTLIDRLLDPSNLSILERVSATFRRDLPPAADAAANLAISFGRLVADAGPFVRQFLVGFDRWTQRLDIATRDTEYMRFRMGEMVAEFRNWLRFLGASVHLLEALFRAATATHTSLHGITGVLNEWTRWIERNPVKMQRFFATSGQLARDLGHTLMFIVHLFGVLGTYLDPLWQSLRVLLGSLGGPLLALLQQIAITAALIGQAFGGLGGPLAIFMRMVTHLLMLVNFLLQHVPLLGTMLAGGLVLAGLTKMVMWMGRFVGLIPRAESEMVVLAAATNRAAAATERLAAAQRMTGGGFYGGGGGVIVPPRGGGVSSGGVILPPGVRAAEEAAVVSRAGRFGGLLNRLRGIPMALRGGIAARLAGGVRGLAGPVGIATLLGTTALSMLPPGMLPGGRTTQSLLTDAGTGAGIGAFGFAAGPVVGGITTTLGAAAGLGYGLWSRYRHHAPTDSRMANLQESMPMYQRQLAHFGGDSPHTIRQVQRQIQLFRGMLTVLGHDQSQAAQQERQAIQSELQLRRTALPQMRQENRHRQFVGAYTFGSNLGRGFNIVNAAQGPVAGMEFVRTHALARWATLGPEGKRVLAQGLLSWADQMRRASPVLAGEAHRIRQAIKARLGGIAADARLVNNAVVTGSRRDWNQIRGAMTTPMEQAREQVTASLTAIQRKAVGALESMGLTPQSAQRLVVRAEGGKPISTPGAIAGKAISQALDSTGFFSSSVRGGPTGGPTGGPDSASGLHPGIRAVAGEVMGAFPGLQITSGVRPWDTRSYHSRGLAVDLAGPGMGSAAAWISGHLGGSLLEGIHNTGLSVKNGRQVDPAFWGGQTWAAHANHIHLAIGDNTPLAAGGARGSVNTRGRSAVGLLPLSAVAPGLSGLQGLPGLLTDATGLLVAGGLAAGVNRATRRRAGATAVRGAVTTSGGAVALGQQMAAARGWTGGQWSALNALWTGESGWNPTARNKSSGAFGIPQALPASKMGAAAVAGDAQAQIAWGLNYIAGRYGTPSRAYQTWLSRSPHWYGDGGRFVARRPQLIGVGEKGAEEVTIRPMRSRAISGGTRGITVHVQIGRIDATGGPGSIREMVRGEIRDAIADVADELDRAGAVPDEDL